MKGAPRRINQHRQVFADRRTRRNRSRGDEHRAAIDEQIEDAFTAEDHAIIAFARMERAVALDRS